MKVVIALLVVSVALGRNLKSLKCTNSMDCTSKKPCCRDSNGQAIVHLEGNVEVIISTNGICSSLLGKESDLCDSSCACKTGYKCYRPMSGFCCPPTRCYNASWVKEQKDYWANCHPPDCFFPP